MAPNGWKKPYWMDGELWWIGSLVLSIICFSNWFIIASFVAPSYLPKESLAVRGWEIPLFMCVGWSFIFGISLGYISERIYDHSLHSPRGAKIGYLLAGFIGTTIFGTMTYLSIQHASLFSPFTFATISPLIWTVVLGLIGISIHE
jgi:drug/metabolite transporter (DMT)-like permease